MILGIGTRKGVTAEEVTLAVSAALDEAHIPLSSIRLFASSRLKEHEAGLLQAVEALGKEIVFLDDETLNRCDPVSSSQASRFGLKGVSEPAALALSNHKKLLFPKKVYGRVTIAIAE